MEQPLALIINFEGVLFDHSRFYRVIVPQILKELGVPPEQIYLDNYWGLRFRDFWQELFRDLKLGHSLTEVRNLAELRYFESIENEKIVPLAGVQQFLENLTTVEAPFAVISMLPLSLIELVCKKQEPEWQFPILICDEHVFQGKPYPEIYQRAARSLNVPIEKILTLEDSKVGVAAASKAEAESMGVKLVNENFQDLTGCLDLIIDLDELPLAEWFSVSHR